MQGNLKHTATEREEHAPSPHHDHGILKQSGSKTFEDKHPTFDKAPEVIASQDAKHQE